MKKRIAFLFPLLAIPLVTTAENSKYVEQGDSLFLCKSIEEARELAKVFDSKDDIPAQRYVEKSKGCGRFPPRAALSFFVLPDTEKSDAAKQSALMTPFGPIPTNKAKNNVVKIRVKDPGESDLKPGEELWLDVQQAQKQIRDYAENCKPNCK